MRVAFFRLFSIADDKEQDLITRQNWVNKCERNKVKWTKSSLLIWA